MGRWIQTHCSRAAKRLKASNPEGWKEERTPCDISVASRHAFMTYRAARLTEIRHPCDRHHLVPWAYLQELLKTNTLSLLYSPSFQNNVCVLSRFSHVRCFATLWTVACQAPLSMGFSRQEYWSGLPCPPSGDLPNPGIKPVSLMSPALAGRFFTTTTHATWEALLEQYLVPSNIWRK